MNIFEFINGLNDIYNEFGDVEVRFEEDGIYFVKTEEIEQK